MFGLQHSRRGRTHTSMGQVNWRRIFAVSSLIVSLVLLGGSIYLHLQQKHHLGRLHHERRTTAIPAVAITTEASVRISPSEPSAGITSSTEIKTSDNSASSASLHSSAIESTDMLQRWKTLHVADSSARRITEACLQCICETATECRPATCGNNMECGIFRISRSYWLDAGMAALDGDNINSSDTNANITYTRCVNNMYCAARVVTAYINKYANDCNRDGSIGCRDHITLHLLGPNGCAQSAGELPPVFARRMQVCLSRLE